MIMKVAGEPRSGRGVGLRGMLLAGMLALLALCPVQAHATHVYLLRGFAGVFSTGLDSLAEQLAKRGYKATVHSFTEAESLGEQAAREQKQGKGPIIIIGHSYGAEAAVTMAEVMKKQGAPVALIVSYGPTVSVAAPSNVHAVVNYYQGGAPFKKGPGFHGSLSNVNLDNSEGINHFNVEKIEKFHKQVIARVRAVASAH
jgi:hypothetical protein